MKQPLFFRIFKNGQLQEVKQIQAAQVVFGSGDEIDISLKGDKVSPIHAMVEERESGFFLCDLGSAGGTLKDGKTILDAQIETSDQFQIGEYTIEFFVGVPKPKAKPPVTDEGASVAPVTQSKPEPQSPSLVESPKNSDDRNKTITVTNLRRDIQPKSSPQSKVEIKAASSKPHSASQDISKPKSVRSSVAALPTYEIAKGSKKKGRWTKTYAPSSPIEDLDEILKPQKGPVVEIIVAWKERVLSTYHYDEKKTVTIGSHPKNDIVIPLLGSTALSYPLVKIESGARVFIGSEANGYISDGRSNQSLAQIRSSSRYEPVGTGGAVNLQQGEILRLDISDMISIYVRYATATPKPILGPFLHFTAGEFSAIIGSAVVTLFIGLYFAVYSPPPVEEEKKTDEPVRKAVFVYQHTETNKVSPEEAKPPEQAKLGEKNTARTEVGQKNPQVKPEKAKTKDDEGKTGEARPNQSKSQVVKLTTPIQGKNNGTPTGGASKTKNKSTAAKSTDVTKTGILSVLSGKGAQDKLAKVYSGAGAVGGLSQSATGAGSQSAIGTGDSPGDGLKELGKGGKGEATVGISGVGTKGRGSGNQGYGTGSIGDKKGVSIIPGGDGEAFEGSIDKEAIRRVVQENMRQVKDCYDRALNKDPGLHGKIILTWVINDRGRVATAKVASSTMNNSEVGQCVVSRLRTWQFPATPAGQEAEVTYPFAFAAQN